MILLHHCVDKVAIVGVVGDQPQPDADGAAGITVELLSETYHPVIPTLSEPDEWHFRKGYVGSKKGAIGLVFHKRHGLVQKILYNE